jgi:fibronectin type 3 domain-containing protein
MKKMIGLFLIIILASGCNRYIDSEDLTQDLPAKPPVPAVLKIVHMTDDILLSWQVADTTGVAKYRIYLGDSLNDQFNIWDSSTTESKVITNLIGGHVYYFRVAAVMRDNLEGTKSSAVATRIGAISVIIDDNAGYTQSRAIGISFVIPVAATLMQLSENNDFANVSWLSFSPTANYTLSEGDGVKWVYARFRFEDGSESGDAIGDSTILDTRAAIDSTYFSAGSSPLSAGEIVTFYVRTGEPGGIASISFTGVTRLELNDNGLDGDMTASDGLYTRRYTIPINLEVSNGVVTGKFTDAAGNSADDRPAAALLNVVKTPVAVSLIATAETSSSVKLSWSQSNESDFSAYHIYRNTTITVSNNSHLVTIITGRGTLTYTDNDLTSNTGYFYRVYVYDNTGRFSPSNVASDTTAVNLAPAAVHLAVRAQDSTSYLTWTTNNDDDFESYLIYRRNSSGVDTTSQLLTIINSNNTTSFDDIRPDISNTYYYKIYVFDRQGLATGSNEVSAP